MLEKLLGAVFGTKNDRELKRLWTRVRDINSVYDSLEGISTCFMLRYVAERARTVDEGIKLVRKGPRSCGTCILIASGNPPDGALLEFDNKRFVARRPKEGFVGADRALKGLQLLRVKDVMTGSPLTAGDGETADTVLGRMEASGADAVAVVDTESRFRGWAGREDLKASGQRTVGEVANMAAATADVNAVLNEALSLMLGSGSKALPIVDGDNRLRGVLTFDAIQEALHEAVKTGGSP